MKKIILILTIFVTYTASSQRFKNLTETDGKIGIGTDKPDALLTVKGKIHTQEVLVDLEGAVAPDYVFETYFDGSSQLKSGYHFLSLPEVETYLKRHYHLPGVPSAQEFSEKGMELKQMNLLLLEKIEELTLHTIEQQHSIEAMQKELKKLRTLLNE